MTPRTELSKISLYISSVCNLSCSYCYVEKNRKSSLTPAKMPYKIICRSIDLLLRNNNKRNSIIHFVGGEPLMNWKGVKEAVNYAKKQGKSVKFTITTNGTLLTEQKVRFLIRNNFDIFISVDSHIADIHNMLRPSMKHGPTFKRTMRAFCLFKNYRNVYAHITWTSYNNKSLLDSLAFFEKKRIEVVIGTIMLPAGPIACRLRPSSSNYFDVLKEYVRRCKKTGHYNAFIPLKNIIYTVKSVKSECESEGKNVVCGGATSSIAVSTNGFIYPCPSLVGIDRFILGSVKSGISHAARKKFISLQMKRKRSLSCQRCLLVGLCHGGCTALCYHNRADPVKNDPLFCSYFRNLVKTAKSLCESDR